MRRAVLVLALVGALVGAFAPIGQASLCVVPGNVNDVHGDTVIAEAPVAPADFFDRGSSMDNPAGKLAAWEAHFNSDVVEGPNPCS